MSAWPQVKLNTVADIERDGLASDNIPAGARYLGLEHIESGGRILGGTVVDAGELASTKFKFTRDHLLYGKLRPYLAKIALPDFEGICSTDIVPIKTGPRLDRRYLAYFLRQPDMVDFANSRSTGANLPRLSPKALAEFEIPLPPLDEQKRIAAILDQADELRCKRQSAIDRLNQLGQAIFYEMFGDPVANPFGWPIRKLGEIGVLDRGISKHRPRNDPALLGGEHPLIQTGDVANADSYIRSFTSTYSDLGLKQSKKWPTGTLCITIAANIGKTAILEIEACFPDSVVGFTPSKDTNAEYVQFWMNCIQKRLEEVAPQSAQKNINLAILRELPIPMPPQQLQNKFRSAIREIEFYKSSLRRSSDDLVSLFSAIQHRAFQGEL
jgi:type I restriction enzyme, S subunit